MSDPAPEVSVVVATRDRAERLERLLRALERQTLERERFEVLIVDDGSHDGSAGVIGAAVDRGAIYVRAVANSGGRGPAVARNRGWRRATGELIAFTDDDCEPAPPWLEAGLGAWSGRPELIVQGTTRPNPADARNRGPLSRTLEIEGATPFFQTCNIFYPRALLERVGGFDERFPGPAGEDSDLGWRAMEVGARRVHEPGALVHHAIEPLTRSEFVLGGLNGVESALSYRRHPALRRQVVYAGLFWNRAHSRLWLAACGLALARRRRAAIALALPYSKSLAGRSRAAGGGPSFAALLVGYDVLNTIRSVRASIRYRVWML